MDLLFEFLLELIIGGSLESVNDSELSKGLRVALLIFSSLIYLLFTALFVWLLFTSEHILLKVISSAVVLLIIGVFVFLWIKVMKAKK